MPITINNQEDIKKMRIAGKLASEVLDFITPLIKPNITTEKIDNLCHDFMTNDFPCVMFMVFLKSKK